MQDAYEQLVKSSGDVDFKNKVKRNFFKRKGGNVHVSFLQSKDEKVIVQGTDGKTWSEIKCYKCLNWGYIATFCPPVDSKVGQQNFKIGISLQQGAIPITT